MTPRPTLTRRRFLVISAAALALPARAEPIRWQGTALGADATLTLHAPAPLAHQAIAIVQQELIRAEAQFSLYKPGSALSQLNATGRLDHPDPDFVALLRQVDAVHTTTSGAFDPTVQPLWQALASGADPATVRHLIGWNRVRVTDTQIRLAPGQSLTLNGIAQGFVTDRIATRLRGLGLTRVLVNIGEFAAIGGPFRMGVTDPRHGQVHTQILQNRAIATSAPAATLLRGHPHILNPQDSENNTDWSSVTVTAPHAGLADALSTAFCLMSPQNIRATLPHHPQTSALLATDSGTLLQI
ncbi:thiamine biosynthesis lipoprotein [Thalassovita litoralis]|jgi:thiamine biosynthesis lipoprotein|uniref:FAD:protein FMN transferase n=1 Tax=Thalassovita litoralis TaxID=1010611 RepID=A0A521FJF1_9RHOB|nr:FAD:protein FMN transferase [Thalassovita litoralis]SMO96352.1 thiamine biosynthesis lipoprotein [Thalassovita litoralis]